jgi:hypothetical protein
MYVRQYVAAVVICLFAASCASAVDAVPMEMEQKLSTVQQAYAQLPLGTQTNVAQVQYAQPPAEQGPYFAPGTYVPPVSTETPCVIAPPTCCEVCGCTGHCAEECNCYRSGWTLGFDVAALEPQVTRGEFGSFPDEASAAIRATLGYEACDGWGIRGIFWGFHDDIDAVSDDVELQMGAFHLDLYKAITPGRGELLIGFGPAAGNLEFRLPDINGRSEFSGGGGSVFAEGYYPFWRRTRWEMAFTGQTRMSLLTGNWKDDTGSVIPPTDDDSMSVFEISYGWELRRRFGQYADHYWYVRIMSEYQRWTSDWMGRFIASGVGLTGTNFSFGVTW